jgi:peptidoglycan L-alanyl-D-glutamate endopeptidase CwlK
MGGVRTAEDQNAIFKEGNSKCDGYKKESYHQSGNALDIIPTGEAPYTQTRKFNKFAQIMFKTWQELLVSGEVKGVLYWGGHWGESGWDKPHWEIK